MESQFKISIPEPCHEDWSKMTTKEKGRFCQSCSKTVVDFSNKSKEEIQQYLQEHFGQQVCGRFRSEQLDSITLEIPAATFQQSLSFHKLFLLVLLLVMGTTLFSCQQSNGKKQPIENVILIDSISEEYFEVEDAKVNNEVMTKDLKTKEEVEAEHIQKDPNFYVGGARLTNFTAITGEAYMNTNINYTKPVPLDSIIEIEEEEEIIEDVPSLDSIEEEEEVDIFIGYIIEDVARFPGAKDFSRADARNDFDQRMKSLFQNHFKAPQASMGIKKGMHKMHIKIVIDSSGRVAEVDVRRAPHSAFTKEIKRVLQKLPVLIPAEQRGKPIRSVYTFPLRVKIE